MSTRHLALFLHAHLPDCRRPALPASLEETWFFEALFECYLPLIGVLDRLTTDAVPARLTLSLSPTLLCMLQDRSLLDRFRRRLGNTIELARRDAEGADGTHREVAAWHAQHLAEMLALFEARCGGDVLAVLRQFHERGVLELATTAATHALLPAHQTHPGTVQAQIGVGLEVFEAAFGFRPSFFWLPECAYYPGLDRMLAVHGVRAFGLESHGVLKAAPPGASVHVPVESPSGVRAIARDGELSRLVWSATQGYPGDFAYREFHRDRIHELDTADVMRWLDGGDARLPSGLKYWRVTGPHDRKAWYDPAAAAERARVHAGDFVSRLSAAARGGEGVWFAPFDAELFGHWWFEGPLWLEHVFRALAMDTTLVRPSTASRAVLDWAPPHRAQPAASSWGEGGDYSFWINHDTAWIYPPLFDAADRLERLLRRHGSAPRDPLVARALRQAARTLLLAQSSDWPFLVRAGTAADASTRWMSGLLGRFDALCAGIERGGIDAEHLAACERTDAAFPAINLAWFLAGRA